MKEFYIPYDNQKLHTKLEMPENAIVPDDNHGFDLHLYQVTSAVEDFLMELK